MRCVGVPAPVSENYDVGGSDNTAHSPNVIILIVESRPLPQFDDMRCAQWTRATPTVEFTSSITWGDADVGIHVQPPPVCETRDAGNGDARRFGFRDGWRTKTGHEKEGR